MRMRSVQLQTMADSKKSGAEKARKIAEKYSGAGQSFQVKYLGAQEVSSAKGDAVIADCLKELRTLFRDVAVHLPKVTITLQLSGITVIDEKSKLETVKVSLNHVSYVCLDPGDSSVFSVVIRSLDTISSKGLRLHAFVCHPQTAITFNRSARELFDFMARMMRAKKKMAGQEASQTVATQPADTLVTPQQVNPVPVPALVLPPLVFHRPPPQPLVPTAAGASLVYASLADEEERQQTVFDEWKDLEKELNSIEQELDLGVGIPEPITSTPTSSPSTSSAVAACVFPASTSPAPLQQQPTPFDIMTASGSDPFGSSFFDLSFNSSQALTATATVATAASQISSEDSHLFDNPFFNGHSTAEPQMSLPLTSTPENKQLTYSSRPRPKGKFLDGPIVSPPPPPHSHITDGDQEHRAVRDVSLSPTGKQEVKNILANTDPFQSPTFDAFPSPPLDNGSNTFQPACFTPSTPDSSFFSPSSVTSIQLVNPVYQSYSLDGSFSAPFASPPQRVVVMMSPPGTAMHPQYPAVPPPLLLQMQPAPMPAQPLVFPNPMGSQGMQMPLVGINSFDGTLSPTVFSSPPSTGSSVQSPHASTLLTERDSMFADLLPSGAHKISVKKKEFEPQKVTPPSLAELQAKKEQEAALRVSTNTSETTSTNTSKTTQDEASEWSSSPFDTVSPTQPTSALHESLLSDSPSMSMTPSSGDQEVSIDSTKQQEVVTLINTLEDFDAAFQEAGKKEHNIESAFEVKFTVKPQPQPAPATNNPFTNASATSPELKKTPWASF